MMKPKISLNDFKNYCLEDCKDIAYQKESYLRGHINRLYDTFCICRSLLAVSTANNILSIGAGSAFVEAQLNKLFNASISVIDFPEMIKLNELHYKKYKFETYPLDLSKKTKLNVSRKFDIILSCEVIEHLPISPSEHIKLFVDSLMTNGYFVITTPNMARFTSCIKLMKGLPLLPDPELTFSPVCFQREGIHRREYVESEIINAFEKNNLNYIRTKYTFFNLAFNLKTLMLFPIGLVMPRFRQIMIIVAQKRGNNSLN